MNTINVHGCWFTAKFGFQIRKYFVHRCWFSPQIWFQENIVFTEVGFHLNSGFTKILWTPIFPPHGQFSSGLFFRANLSVSKMFRLWSIKKDYVGTASVNQLVNEAVGRTTNMMFMLVKNISFRKKSFQNPRTVSKLPGQY